MICATLSSNVNDTFRAEIDADCRDARGNNDVAFWSQARLHIIQLTQDRISRSITDEDAAPNYHACWYRLIALAQLLDADHAAQDRLAIQVLFAR